MKGTTPIKRAALALSAVALATFLTGCGAKEESRTQPQGAAGTVITLSGDTAAVQGSGATADGGVVTITQGGTYTVTGTLTDGRVLVNAKGAEVTLVLDGADITCSTGSPLYIYKAALATIELPEGSQSTLTDGASYTFADTLSSQADEEPNACLYSKADLVIQGAGALTVNGNYQNGLTGKDTLVMRESDITVNAVGHGVNGKDSATLEGVTLTVTAGEDALRSTNDTDATLGWIRVADSYLTLTAGDDAIHAEGELTVESGKVDVLASHEGLEASTVTISGGEVSVVADDDGVNAGGSGSHAIQISGGTVTVVAGGDGLDSNGSMSISGGAVTVYSGGQADGALDADGGMDISGGVVFAATGGSMPGTPRDPAQNTLSVAFGQTLAAGERVRFAGEGWEYTFTLAGAANSAVFSAPELVEGQSCAVTLVGEGEDTPLCELTVESGLTTYGDAGGFGGMGGGKGGFGGQRPMDGQGGFDGQTPPEGEMPQRGDRTPPEDGEFPADRVRPEDGTFPGGKGGRGGMPGDRAGEPAPTAES